MEIEQYYCFIQIYIKHGLYVRLFAMCWTAIGKKEIPCLRELIFSLRRQEINKYFQVRRWVLRRGSRLVMLEGDVVEISDYSACVKALDFAREEMRSQGWFQAEKSYYMTWILGLLWVSCGENCCRLATMEIVKPFRELCLLPTEV